MISGFRPDGEGLRYFGVYPAIVTNIVDPESLGHILVLLGQSAKHCSLWDINCERAD